MDPSLGLKAKLKSSLFSDIYFVLPPTVKPAELSQSPKVSELLWNSRVLAEAGARQGLEHTRRLKS